jgi:hypothetical protein
MCDACNFFLDGVIVCVRVCVCARKYVQGQDNHEYIRRAHTKVDTNEDTLQVLWKH